MPVQSDWMGLALEQAEQARAENEVPVGAVIVRDNKLIATGYNQPIGLHDPTGHAEVMALRQAGHTLQNYRLIGCDLYVTLEPCIMCVGALIHARVRRVIFATPDPKTGALGGAFDFFQIFQPNHRFAVLSGDRSEDAQRLLKDFFLKKRRNGGN